MLVVARFVHHGQEDQSRRTATDCQVAQETSTSLVEDSVQRFWPRMQHGLSCTVRRTNPSRGACTPTESRMLVGDLLAWTSIYSRGIGRRLFHLVHAVAVLPC